MPTPTIASEWDGFWAAVRPKNAPPVQAQECRRAFYAGASAMLTLCQQAGDAATEGEGVAALAGYSRELELFLAALRAGRA